MGMSCFFFKQKTAYEMRISDWSSDACSSDLGVGIGAEGIIAVGEGDIADDGAEGGRLIQRDRRAPGPRREAGKAQRTVIDRKSVVEGTRVAGSVDLGGRCYLKTQTERINLHGE